MTEKTTSILDADTPLSADEQAMLVRLAAISDSDIDCSDIPLRPLDANGHQEQVAFDPVSSYPTSDKHAYGTPLAQTTTLPVLDMVFPGKAQGSPQAERRFLQRLKSLMPRSVRPILVTDAGYRTPWFEAVSAIGWEWVRRLRGTTLAKPLDVEDQPGEWVPCRALYQLLTESRVNCR